MRRLVGYTLFWFALGMIFMLILENTWLALVLIALFLIIGYNLFHVC